MCWLAYLLLQEGAAVNAVDAMGRAAIQFVPILLGTWTCSEHSYTVLQIDCKCCYELLLKQGATIPEDLYGLQWLFSEV